MLNPISSLELKFQANSESPLFVDWNEFLFESYEEDLCYETRNLFRGGIDNTAPRLVCTPVALLRRGELGAPVAFKGRDFVFGNFLTISADLKILKQPNHVKHLRIFSTIFEILKTLPLKGPRSGIRGSRVVSYEKRKISKSLFLVLKHRF
jgi:hypothetical protein